VQGLPVDSKPLEPPLTRLPVRAHNCKCVMLRIDVDQPKLLIAEAWRIAAGLNKIELEQIGQRKHIARQFYFLACSKSLPVLGLTR
jgi:hypothetical protein